MSAISGLFVIPSIFININTTWTKIYTATYEVKESDEEVPFSILYCFQLNDNVVASMIHVANTLIVCWT